MSDALLYLPEKARVVLPPHGFVHLQRACADDLDVVNAARVSLSQQSHWGFDVTADRGNLAKRFTDADDADDWANTLEDGGYEDVLVSNVLGEKDAGLINYLLTKKHGTPFEHTYFKFHVKAPIFVFREWHRHRIGVSINEESARYTPLKREFYIPEPEAWRKQVGKPGHYTYEKLIQGEQEEHQQRLEEVYNHAFDEYEEMMKFGVAKELARAVLPVATYSQMIWSCNARSLMNFLVLRNADTALHEIKVYADAMEDMFHEHMPVTYTAFRENGRVAP